MTASAQAGARGREPAICRQGLYQPAHTRPALCVQHAWTIPLLGGPRPSRGAALTAEFGSCDPQKQQSKVASTALGTAGPGTALQEQQAQAQPQGQQAYIFVITYSHPTWRKRHLARVKHWPGHFCVKHWLGHHHSLPIRHGARGIWRT